MDILKEIYYFLSISETEEMARTTSDFEEDSRIIFANPLYWVNRFYYKFGWYPNHQNVKYLHDLLLLYEADIQDLDLFYSNYPPSHDIDEDFYQLAKLSDLPINIEAKGYIHIEAIIRLVELHHFSLNQAFIDMDDEESLNLASQFSGQDQFDRFVKAVGFEYEDRDALLSAVFATNNPDEFDFAEARDIYYLTKYGTPEVYKMRLPLSRNLIIDNIRSITIVNDPLLDYLCDTDSELVTDYLINRLTWKQFLHVRDILNITSEIEATQLIDLFSVDEFYQDGRAKKYLKLTKRHPFLNDESYRMFGNAMIRLLSNKNFRPLLLNNLKEFERIFYPGSLQEVKYGAIQKEDKEIFDLLKTKTIDEITYALSGKVSNDFFAYVTKDVKLEEQSIPSKKLTNLLVLSNKSKITTFLNKKHSSSYLNFKEMGITPGITTLSKKLQLQNIVLICKLSTGTGKRDLFYVLSNLVEYIKTQSLDDDEHRKFVKSFRKIVKLCPDLKPLKNPKIDITELVKSTGDNNLISIVKKYK